MWKWRICPRCHPCCDWDKFRRCTSLKSYGRLTQPKLSLLNYAGGGRSAFWFAFTFFFTSLEFKLFALLRIIIIYFPFGCFHLLFAVLIGISLWYFDANTLIRPVHLFQYFLLPLLLVCVFSVACVCLRMLCTSSSMCYYYIFFWRELETRKMREIAPKCEFASHELFAGCCISWSCSPSGLHSAHAKCMPWIKKTIWFATVFHFPLSILFALDFT